MTQQNVKCFSLLAILSSMLQLGCVPMASTPRPVLDGTKIRLGLRSEDAKPITIGSPVVVAVDVVNLMNSPSSLSRGATDDTSFMLELFCDGKAVQLSDYGRDCQAEAKEANFLWDLSKGGGDFKFIGENLPPLAIARHQINVGKLFKVDRAGEYVLVIRRNVSIEEGILAGTSSRFTITGASDRTGE